MEERHSLLLGPLVSAKYPKFVGRLGREHRLQIVGTGQFNSLLPANPWDRSVDLVLVDRSILHLATTWTIALDRLGANPPPIALVQHEPSVALHVLAAHSGAVGIVDPLLDWDSITGALHRAMSQPEIGDDGHRIWTEVERPLTFHDADIEMRDDVDQDIVDLVSLGLADREVAAAVHLAEQTVRNRLSRILEHSGLKNRTQLAMRRRSQLEAGTIVTLFAWWQHSASIEPPPDETGR